MIKKNIFSLTVAIVILILSFTSPGTFSNLNLPNIKNLDKLVHLGMYFILMAALIFENRRSLNSVKTCLLLSFIPLLFGALIEVLQSMLTMWRKGDILDFLFNFTGIILALGVWLLIRKRSRMPAK